MTRKGRNLKRSTMNVDGDVGHNSDSNIKDVNMDAEPKQSSSCSQGNNMSSYTVILNSKVHKQQDNMKNQYFGGIKGIQNLGNTCFMNAALQALSHLTPLKVYFLHTYFRRLRYQSDQSIDSLFDNFMRSMWSCPSDQQGSNSRQKLPLKDCYGLSTEIVSPVAARSLVAFIWKRFPFLTPGDQHDSQEFIHCFLNELHDSLKFPNYNPVEFDDSYSSSCGDSKESQLNLDKSNSKDFNSKSICSADERNCTNQKSSCQSLPDLACELIDIASSEHFDSNLYKNKIDEFIQLTNFPDESLFEELDEYNRNVKFQASPVVKTPSTSNSCTSFSSGQSSCSLSSSSTPVHSPNYYPKVLSPRESLYKFYNPNYMQNRSIISDVFTGQLESTIRCTNCNNVSVQLEKFQDLSIPISVIDKAIQSKYRTNSYGLNSIPLQRIADVNTENPPDSLFDRPNQNSFLKWSFLYGLDFIKSYYNYIWNWVDWFASFVSTPSVQLNECLEMFFNPELLRGENRYACENCRQLCNGIKCIRIHRLPEVLMIHLNRYQNINYNLWKITSQLNFPLVDFSVRRFMSDSSIQSYSLEDGSDLYDLVAVICHNGSQVSNGHYICYALNDENLEWYEYDDTVVRYVSKDEVLSAASSAYILFYQRTTNLSRSASALNVIYDIEHHWLENYCDSKDFNYNLFKDYYFLSQHCNYVGNSFQSNFPSDSFINLKSFNISKYWLNCFLTFYNPGPIDNSDIFCSHNMIRPTEWLFFNSLSVPLIEPVGRFLWYLYNGGPIYDKSSPSPICPHCVSSLDILRYRRMQEFSHFKMLQSTEEYVFKRLKMKKADLEIEFEINDQEEDEHIKFNDICIDDCLVRPDDLPIAEFTDDTKNFTYNLQTESIVEVPDVVVPESEQCDNNAKSETNLMLPYKYNVTQQNNDVDLYEKFKEEEGYYYLISAEWMNKWFNFVNVNFDEATVPARDRQLNALYQRISKNKQDSSQSTNSEQEHSYRAPLMTDVMSIHPPLSSLIKSFGSSGKSSATDIEQVWQQIDFILHTILPPGPIDNWSMFGIKRKLLGELRKTNKRQQGNQPSVTMESMSNYEELCALFTKILIDHSHAGDNSTFESNPKNLPDLAPFTYTFSFSSRQYGISEESRSCQFYLVSREYWNLLHQIYGGGPVITFNYITATHKFDMKISVSDVEYFLREHYKGQMSSSKMQTDPDTVGAETSQPESNMSQDDAAQPGGSGLRRRKIPNTVIQDEGDCYDTPIGQVNSEHMDTVD